MNLSVDTHRRKGSSQPQGVDAFWVSLPTSVLLHAIALGLLLVWLNEQRPLPVRPGPLTVTLLPSSTETTGADVPAGAELETRGITPGPVRPARQEPKTPAVDPQPEPRTEPRPSPTPEPPIARSPDPADDANRPARPESRKDARAIALSRPAPRDVDPQPANRENTVQRHAIEAAYLADVRRAIEAARYYPRRARRLGQQGTVELRFEILQDGRIAGAEVQAGSGSRALDSAALDILDRVGRFAPLPDSLDRPSLMVQLPVDYRLY
jgi:protein TonB